MRRWRVVKNERGGGWSSSSRSPLRRKGGSPTSSFLTSSFPTSSFPTSSSTYFQLFLLLTFLHLAFPTSGFSHHYCLASKSVYGNMFDKKYFQKSKKLKVGKARSKKLEVGKLEVKKVRSRKIRSRRCWMQEKLEVGKVRSRKVRCRKAGSNKAGSRGAVLALPSIRFS